MELAAKYLVDDFHLDWHFSLMHPFSISAMLSPWLNNVAWRRMKPICLEAKISAQLKESQMDY